MKVEIDKVFPIEAPSSDAWTFLQNISNVVGCMPGAEITEQVDDLNYKGKVKVKVGPATMAFKGDIAMLSIDADKRELKLCAKGMDVKGTSSATMELTACIRETENGKCEVSGVSVISITGIMASLGGRLMNQVADRILDQFGANFNNNVIAMGEGEVAEAAAAKAAEQAKEFNGLAFVWSLFIDFFKKLFGGKS